MRGENHDTARVLTRLKDFQRRTVEYVYRRFYADDPTTDRFLVADEVGLGKTFVARGVIAKAIDHLRAVNQSGRIDIVYICSNASIASQNINRLNVSGVQEFVKPTRLTLLGREIEQIRQNASNENAVHYIGLTPGTSFDPKSREGRVEERVLIFQLLRREAGLSQAGLRNLLQCRMQRGNWLDWIKWKPQADESVRANFLSSIVGDKELLERLRSFCKRSCRRILWDDPERLALVYALRQRLASVSIDLLQPKLIILDEFQRFKNLLDEGNPEAFLAQQLFRYPNAKTLLLSATPYKMLSLDHEQGDDHYPDFLKTLEFLFGDKAAVGETEAEIRAFRHALYSLAGGETKAIRTARDALQKRLRSVMCRTERVAMTRDQDAMLGEVREETVLKPVDLHQASLANQVADCIGARDIVEYWKSSPYLVNFLRRYDFRQKLERECDHPSDELLSSLQQHKGRLLSRKEIERYREIEPANPRMRALLNGTVEKGLWRILWMPPSMPYIAPAGPFAGIGDATKQLVFSAWNVVPDAISALCSYEAERRMVGKGAGFQHRDLYDKLRPLLVFTRGQEGRLSGMPALSMLYPCPSLAALADPLQLALNRDKVGPLPLEEAVKEVEGMLRPLAAQWLANAPASGIEDQRWFWALPVMLDAERFPRMREWLEDGEEGWLSVRMEDAGNPGEGFAEHVALFREAMDGRLDPPLGKPPEQLLRVVAAMALADPGVCGLRALRRVAPSLGWDHAALLHGAAAISSGFRTLFNLPETIALLRASDPGEPYWRLALRHCLDGNVQAVLDEQAHCLVESLGAIDQEEPERAQKVGEAIRSALAIRTSQLQLDEVKPHARRGKIKISAYNTRCRFALRFGELHDDSGATLARTDAVRDAFNSPFRPFVLASTSIGQEGLDFHTWCHAVVHWNLPANPVDLEQREGRVHRYKGHAIRKNVAMNFGLEALRSEWDGSGDPWSCLFDMARRETPGGAYDLAPCWLYETEGGARVERRLHILPFSKEAAHYRNLKRMLALYRLVFGQPRQQDVLHYLSERMDLHEAQKAASQWRIDLSPSDTPRPP